MMWTDFTHERSNAESNARHRKEKIMNINRSHNFNHWQIAKRINAAQLKAVLVLALVCLITLALRVVQVASAGGAGSGGGGITHLMM
jgi:hypothetical protein